jgi:hypothetical protein
MDRSVLLNQVKAAAFERSLSEGTLYDDEGRIVSLTRSAAMELAPRIRVNAIAPGKMHTAFRKRMLGTDLTEAEAREIGAKIPLQKIGMPGDVAAAVAFLASDDAAFTGGIVLPVEGGKTAGRSGRCARPGRWHANWARASRRWRTTADGRDAAGRPTVSSAGARSGGLSG